MQGSPSLPARRRSTTRRRLSVTGSGGTCRTACPASRSPPRRLPPILPTTPQPSTRATGARPGRQPPRADAPSAMRVPNSGVRCDTENDTTPNRPAVASSNATSAKPPSQDDHVIARLCPGRASGNVCRFSTATEGATDATTLRTPLARAAGSCPSMMNVMRRVAGGIGIQIRGGGADIRSVLATSSDTPTTDTTAAPGRVGTQHCARWPVRRRRNSALPPPG